MKISCSSIWVKRPFIVAYVSVLMLALTAMLLVDVIPPKSRTISHIHETFERMAIYAKMNHAIPPSLTVLPIREGYINSIKDGWGRVLIYNVNAVGVATLTSFGKDGRPGGTGDDADISNSYYTRRTDGSLWIGSELWMVEAEVH